MKRHRWVKWGLAVGVPATLLMDAGAAALRSLGLTRGLPPFAFGRWFGHLAQGTTSHQDVLTATHVPGEIWIAMAAHYVIGSLLATVYLALTATQRRTPGPRYALTSSAVAVLYGVSTTALAWLVMYPSMGYGLAGLAAPPEMRLFVSSLANHMLYGVGLAIWSYLFRRRLAPTLSPNPGYLEAEARLFRRLGLVATVRPLSLGVPPIRLRVVEIGSGAPVLFLHGFSHCAATWAPLLPRLPDARCILLDLPGHGAADAVDFRGQDLRRWFNTMLTGCLDELGLDAVHVVGHSQGAMFALWLAHAAPERVRSITAIGVPAVAFGARIEALRLLARPGLGRLLLRLPMPPPAYRRVLAGTLGRGAVRSQPDLVRAIHRATHRSGYATTVSSELRELFRGIDAEPRRYALRDDELRSIRRPVLVLWGERDTRFQAIADAKAKTALLPHGRFELIAGEHTPWLDDPATCARLIAALHRGEQVQPSIAPPSTGS